MDKRLEAIIPQDSSIEAWEYAGGVEAGFKFAIQRIRENKFYGYQGELVADWLEKHLIQEVNSDRSKDK